MQGGEGAPGQAQIAPLVVTSPWPRATRPGQGRHEGRPGAAPSAVISRCPPAKSPAPVVLPRPGAPL
eukprot:4559941-Lingulodinium_polyedra.AAC.1